MSPNGLKRRATAVLACISLFFGMTAPPEALAADGAEAVDTPLHIAVSGETRVRYESLDGQFRAGRSGSDQALFLRTLLAVEAGKGPFTATLEIQDSRSYLDDSGTPLSTSYVNALDILQANVSMELPAWKSVDADLIVGRQTVSIGSKRQIERVSYANVIKTYTGAHLVAGTPRGDEFHAILVVPVRGLPSDRDEIADNVIEADEEQWGRRIWGLHYRRADILAQTVPGLWGEAFVYGLEEEDRVDNPTPDRSYVTPGLRLYRAPVAGQWDVDLEGAWRTGSRRASNLPADTRDLDVSAGMLFAALGYTFERPWQPRVAVEYYYASGDDDPDDDRFDQYERLFGSRRTDLNNTSLHGPVTPANINAPGVRLSVTPGPRSDAMVKIASTSLASATDSWVIARLRDPSGQSGKSIGTMIDGRARYWLVEDRVQAELGASALFYGEFAETVPGGPEGERTLFGYAQIRYDF
ncbi:alginate export family protein [Aquisalinus flavus]|uniref:Alginate export domain-containing protein n=1 Tax=Aquisalinus flavus TaxID=1526572 RepID=A0A8J2V7A4_9PROT|nr:alginate export family protein [Aquisalinus flavus]MBD0425335.1 alginate export family protein [Aquisalinus flavus]UNE49013.1 hypothetical protein FF099_13625 [Aquisalinus flavus]GGD16913.1 hypothetical protein GCM10011342_27080 [Aquisalinus flavus]